MAMRYWGSSMAVVTVLVYLSECTLFLYTIAHNFTMRDEM